MIRMDHQVMPHVHGATIFCGNGNVYSAGMTCMGGNIIHNVQDHDRYGSMSVESFLYGIGHTLIYYIMYV